MAAEFRRLPFLHRTKGRSLQATTGEIFFSARKLRLRAEMRIGTYPFFD